MLGNVVNIIFAALIIVASVLVVVAIWKSVYGTDKAVVNQYRTIGDLIQGVIETDRIGDVTRRQTLFNFHVQRDAKSFSGTVFAVSSDGVITAPIPPLPGQRLTEKEVKLLLPDGSEELPGGEAARCRDRACLCLSLFSVSIEDKENNFAQIVKNTEGCRVLGQKDQKIILDFDTFQEDLDATWASYLTEDPDYWQYPTVTIWRDECKKNSNAHDFSDAICIFTKTMVESDD